MRIEIRLRDLLMQIGKDERGVLKKLAERAGVHRHTIENLYHDRAENPSLALLSTICDWLQENGMPAERLPRDLWGRGAQKLWESCASRGSVTLCLGENRQQAPGPRRPLWISKRDTAAAFRLVQLLSDPEVTKRKHTEIHTRYVPYHFPLDHEGAKDPEDFTRDVAEAQEAHREFSQVGKASILIGSVKTNYALEFLVAELFRCKPFHSPGKRVPPIYLQYRSTDRRVPSCMAGDGPPPEFEGKARPGIYFLGVGGWEAAPSSDTGVVIVSDEPPTRKLRIAIFGFRGRVTQALVAPLMERAEQFWPEGGLIGKRRVGVVLCGFSFKAEHSFGEDQGRLEWVRPISAGVLRKCVSQR